MGTTGAEFRRYVTRIIGNRDQNSRDPGRLVRDFASGVDRHEPEKDCLLLLGNRFSAGSGSAETPQGIQNIALGGCRLDRHCGFKNSAPAAR